MYPAVGHVAGRLEEMLHNGQAARLMKGHSPLPAVLGGEGGSVVEAEVPVIVVNAYNYTSKFQMPRPPANSTQREFARELSRRDQGGGAADTDRLYTGMQALANFFASSDATGLLK